MVVLQMFSLLLTSYLLYDIGMFIFGVLIVTFSFNLFFRLFRKGYMK